MEQLDSVEAKEQEKDDTIVLNESNITNYIRQQEEEMVRGKGETQIAKVEEQLAIDLRNLENQLENGDSNPNNDIIEGYKQEIQTISQAMKKMEIRMQGQVVGYDSKMGGEEKYNELKRQLADAKLNLEIDEATGNQEAQNTHADKIANLKTQSQESINNIREGMDKQLTEGGISEAEMQILMTSLNTHLERLNTKIDDMINVGRGDSGDLELDIKEAEFKAVDSVAQQIEGEVNKVINKFINGENIADQNMLASLPDNELKVLLAAHTEQAKEATASIDRKNPGDNWLLNTVRDYTKLGEKPNIIKN